MGLICESRASGDYYFLISYNRHEDFYNQKKESFQRVIYSHFKSEMAIVSVCKTG